MTTVTGELYEALREALNAQRPVALATVIDGPGVGATLLVRPGSAPLGSLGNPELDRVVTRDARAELDAGRRSVRHYGPAGQTTPEDLDDSPVVSVFFDVFAAPAQMWIFGAVDFTAALATVAKVLGYRVVVCDARQTFATARRFPMADEVIAGWPDALFAERAGELGAADAVCILTHDPKFDLPAISGALTSRAGYIGVMGSRGTHARRLERLAEAGIDGPEQLARLHAPIGLDIGARTPEETAVSICAEIIAAKTGRPGGSLRDGTGAIHAAGPAR